MALTHKKLSQNQLTAAAVTQYTVPAVTTTRVTEIIVTNTDTVERTLEVSFVPSGGAQGVTNRIIDDMPIAPKSTVIISLMVVMGAGDFISALASAASAINLYISGAEIT